jgi:hypothetical protein
VWVEWADRGASMLLVKLSRSGALVLSPFAIPPAEPVFLSLEHHELPAWFGAVVVRFVEGSRFHQLHLAFDSPCPARIFEAAIQRIPCPMLVVELPATDERLYMLPLLSGVVPAGPTPCGKPNSRVTRGHLG